LSIAKRRPPLVENALHGKPEGVVMGIDGFGVERAAGRGRAAARRGLMALLRRRRSAVVARSPLALLQVLQERRDPTFSKHSFGFRPGRSADQALAQAQQYIAAGYSVVVDLDLEKFLERTA
jgi:hypothetical protein